MVILLAQVYFRANQTHSVFTKSRFQTDAQGESEMAYRILLSIIILVCFR